MTKKEVKCADCHDTKVSTFCVCHTCQPKEAERLDCDDVRCAASGECVCAFKTPPIPLRKPEPKPEVEECVECSLIGEQSCSEHCKKVEEWEQELTDHISYGRECGLQHIHGNIHNFVKNKIAQARTQALEEAAEIVDEMKQMEIPLKSDYTLWKIMLKNVTEAKQKILALNNPSK